MFIFPTVLSQMALHQPGFGMARIFAEDSIKEDLCDLPSFFGHRPGSVRSIDANM
jgi:hypothetical protein